MFLQINLQGKYNIQASVQEETQAPKLKYT